MISQDCIPYTQNYGKRNPRIISNYRKKKKKFLEGCTKQKNIKRGKHLKVSSAPTTSSHIIGVRDTDPVYLLF